MADHLCVQHRNRISALATAAGLTYVRVSPVTNAEESRLPAVEIDTISDQRAGEDRGGWPIQLREHQVRVQIKTKAAGAIANTLDNLAAPLTAAIANDPTLNGTAKLARLAELQHEKDELDQPTGVLVQVWMVLYRVDQRDPDTAVA